MFVCPSARCSARKEGKKANMKRENKAYSYKEQIIELELQEVTRHHSVSLVSVAPTSASLFQLLSSNY